MLTARDIGRGLLPQRDSRPPRLALLGTTWQAGLRDEAVQLATWLGATVACAALMGGLVKTVLDFVNDTPAVGRLLGRSVVTDGYVAAMFSLVQVVGALLVVAMAVAARGEEATGRLEILFATPRSRTGWLLGRILVAATSAAVLTLAAAGALWVGAEASGARLGSGALLSATGNCLPLIVITAGVVTAVLGVAPRAVPFVYGLIAVASLWDALGGLLNAPDWTLNLSPFHALAQVPLHSFAPVPATVLSVLGVALVLFGLGGFRRRDLVTG